MVVGPQYCLQDYVDLTITEKVNDAADGFYTVTDVKSRLIFRIEHRIFSFRDKRILFDASEEPVITLQEKIMTAHGRWQAFRGESTNPKDLLFSAKRSSLTQNLSFDLDVFLASNRSEQKCDFKIKGDFFDRSCTVFLGDSAKAVAQVRKKHSVKNVIFGDDSFGLTIHPYVDYAFVVSLIVILDEIYKVEDED
ncbi:protein LURP-one-related 15-like [Aristolochia californica]|uniref:protein LURP-one-related 15-like n=1 Tax=Aristolochia californica TaxID=171875 RepID=UPI0035E3B5FE